MKRFLTLLLAAAMVLSFAACGDNGTTIRNEKEEDNVKKDPIAAQYLQDLAVKTADYPVLPAMPNESELDEAFSTIDYDKMGAGNCSALRRPRARQSDVQLHGRDQKVSAHLFHVTLPHPEPARSHMLNLDCVN